MTTDNATVPADAGREGQIAALLERYPDITASEIEDIKTWWMRKASSLDIALLSGRQDIAEGYAAFRKDHIDPLPASGRTLTWLLSGAILAGLAAYMVM
jgi:hypothetical protein